MKFTNSKSSYSATKAELIRFGRDYANDQKLDEAAAYKKGVEQFVISFAELDKVFRDDPTLRENTIIVVSNKSGDGVSGIANHQDFFIGKSESQLDATRRSLYQFSDAIFSSNENDVKYFIGKGSDDEKAVMRKCGSLKPCYHGSDAHSNEKIFKPDDNRFCWIKADPTFEGLKQTLYEPADRVRIQSVLPDVKNDRYVISELQFIDKDNLVGNSKILLNDNLNAIIGGKSSGKSLLIFSTARSIDPEQVDRTSKRLNFEGYKFATPFDFKVVWKNGETDLLSKEDGGLKLHKITYIPQLYINYLVEKNNKAELNDLIANILLQDAPFKAFYDERKQLIEATNTEIERLLDNYLKVRTTALGVQQQSKDTGKSDTIQKAIEKIEATLLDGQKRTNMTEEQIRDYSALVSKKSEYDSELSKIRSKATILAKVLAEVRLSRANLLGKTEPTNKVYLKGQVDRILDEFGTVPPDIQEIKKKLDSDFDKMIVNLETEISKLNLPKIIIELNAKIGVNTENLKPFLTKIAGQEELGKLSIQIENEKNKLQKAQNLENQLKSLADDYNNIRIQTASLLKKRLEIYQEIEKKVNDTRKNIGSDIELNCSLIYKQSNFALYEQANKTAISNDHFFNTLFKDGLVEYQLVPDFYAKSLRIHDDKLYSSADEFIPLKKGASLEGVLRGLIKDSFELDYSVTYNEDDLLKMSPGKKGTVLLILFLEISSAEFPILIDQPEDNLDNRTIYDLLCKMIKEKKKERQIIIVSHNANLVVATDTENVIVANQQGQDTKVVAGSSRFEYVNGSLEHSFPKNDAIPSILLSQGIREHVCDILEGGGEAFKQRERKYAIKL